MAETQKKYRNIPRYVTRFARILRLSMTPAEQLLWQHISNRQLAGLRFRRQHPIGRYIADFYNHETKLVIELDGPIHDKQKEYDKNRDKYLKAVGNVILRFKNEQVASDLPSVLNNILQIASQRRLSILPNSP
jgi:very-short-patch-repair endonuclease